MHVIVLNVILLSVGAPNLITPITKIIFKIFSEKFTIKS
jgi:hypothetical protein